MITMNPQMARHLYNETCAQGTGRLDESGEETSVTSLLWAAAIGHGAPTYVYANHTEMPEHIEARARVAQFLRDWADAIEYQPKLATETEPAEAEGSGTLI